MLEADSKWRLRSGSLQKSDELAKELQISPLVAKLLILRGVHTKEEAERFLYDGKDQMHDPFLMKGMTKAVSRIRDAAQRREKIRICGDYDADGVSSTSILICILKHLRIPFDFYIPNRFTEGYGLNRDAVEQASREGIQLIVTVDNGISAYDAVERANELGLDVIVTDHHEPPEQLPKAFSIVNPKQPGCEYPFKQLAGAGVALKLGQALLGNIPDEWFELAAIGTVADLMPLLDENRIIVKTGLQQLQHSRFPGLCALMKLANVKRENISATDIGFSLGPRINAPGRLAHAEAAVRLMITDAEDEAQLLAERLDVLNRKRQKIVEQITREALAQIEQEQMQDHPFLVVAKEHWHHGVVGIVASKLLDKFYRPVIVLSIDPDTGLAKGSARSIERFDIHKALVNCDDLLEHYGGHQAAGGMTLKVEHIEAFRTKLHQLTNEWLTEEDFVPIKDADIECSLNEISLDSIAELQILAPYGAGNPYPTVIVKELEVEQKRVIGKDGQHLKMALRSSGSPVIDGIAFGKGCYSPYIEPYAKLDLLCRPDINEWNGIRKPQLLIQDMCIPMVQVADWRMKDAYQSMLDWVKTSEQEDPLLRGIIVFSKGTESAELWKPLLEMLPLWKVDEQGQLHPENDLAVKSDCERLKEVVIYGIPLSKEQLATAIGHLGSVHRLFAALWEDAPDYTPDRTVFVQVYKKMIQLQEWKSDRSTLQALADYFRLSLDSLIFIHRVFEELQFIERNGGSCRCLDSPKKKDLTESKLYQSRSLRTRFKQWLNYVSTRELADWIRAHLPADRDKIKHIILEEAK